MEVAAGAELSEEAEPLGRVHASVERGEERVVQHLQDLLLRLRPPFLAPARELPLVHDLGREKRERGVTGDRGRSAVELRQVD